MLEEVENSTVIADKVYESNYLLEAIDKRNSIAVIPPKKNRKIQREYDVHIYKERHLIKCFFRKMKHFRRVFSRFDKTANVFMEF